MGVNNRHPQCRLIEDNNTPTLIRTQTRELPTKSVRMIVCVSLRRHAHAYVNVTHDAGMRTRVSTHLYNPCPLTSMPVDQNKAAEGLYMQPCGWRLNSGFKKQGNYGSQCKVWPRTQVSGLTLLAKLQRSICTLRAQSTQQRLYEKYRFDLGFLSSGSGGKKKKDWKI